MYVILYSPHINLSTPGRIAEKTPQFWGVMILMNIFLRRVELYT